MSDSVTPRTIACQAPLPMEFSRQEYWSGLPFPSPGDLLNVGMEPGSPSMQADSLPSEPLGGGMQIGSAIQFSAQSCQTLRHHGLQHARPPCPSRMGANSNSCPFTNGSLLKLMSIESVMQSSHLTYCHSFSSCLQYFPASGSFQMSQLFTSGDQSIGVSASTSVLPMNIQDWFPLWWTSWISLQSKGHSRVFSNTIVQKHQFCSAHLSL